MNCDECPAVGSEMCPRTWGFPCPDYNVEADKFMECDERLEMAYDERFDRGMMDAPD